MPSRLHPGVYVEEVSGGARSIEAVGTSTAIFVGETERGPLEPVKIRNFAEFERLYGGYLRAKGPGTESVTLAYAVDGFFQNGGTTAYILRAVESGLAVGHRSYDDAGNITPLLTATSPGVWARDQLRTLIGPASDNVSGHRRVAVLFKDLTTNSWRVAENWDRLSDDPADDNFVVSVLERSLYVRWAAGTPPSNLTAAPTDTALTSPTDAQLLELIPGLAPQFTDAAGGDAAVGEARYAQLLRTLDGVTDASLLALPGKTGSFAEAGVAYVESRSLRDLFYIADLPPQGGPDVNAALQSTLDALKLMTRTDLGAVYWPWIQVADPVGAGQGSTAVVPPSGHVAGLYARTDARRGVWKAPAGVEAAVLGIQSLQHRLLDSHQDDMNPAGLNALRLLPAAGAVVWGSRTLRPSSEWRYIPVRRTAIFLRKSLYEGLQWAIFEPNSETLWASLRVAAESFMEQLFRQGAFAGRTSREAYFVKCDAETTPPADQNAGIVNVWVGFAPLRPAEFVVIQLSQKVDQKA
ncbi:MAG: phage tail sheath family protein [Myxococcaceae bacterium]|nr:phage tail sheath family protein [Myxococcaceae bacterium]